MEKKQQIQKTRNNYYLCVKCQLSFLLKELKKGMCKDCLSKDSDLKKNAIEKKHNPLNVEINNNWENHL